MNRDESTRGANLQSPTTQGSGKSTSFGNSSFTGAPPSETPASRGPAGTSRKTYLRKLQLHGGRRKPRERPNRDDGDEFCDEFGTTFQRKELRIIHTHWVEVERRQPIIPRSLHVRRQDLGRIVRLIWDNMEAPRRPRTARCAASTEYILTIMPQDVLCPPRRDQCRKVL